MGPNSDNGPSDYAKEGGYLSYSPAGSQRRVTGALTQSSALCNSERRRGDDLFDGAIGDVVDETGHDEGVG